MKATINQDDCISCGLCAETCPEVFRMGSDKAEVYCDEISKDSEETAKEARDNCPVEVISIQ